jgi:hypothetical protein
VVIFIVTDVRISDIEYSINVTCRISSETSVTIYQTTFLHIPEDVSVIVTTVLVSKSWKWMKDFPSKRSELYIKLQEVRTQKTNFHRPRVFEKKKCWHGCLDQR